MRTASWAAITALTLITTTSALAQVAGQATPPQPDAAHATMLLTGCLAAGPDDSTFKLTKASPVLPPSNARADAAAPQPTGTSGEVSEYELKAEARLDAASVAPIDLKPFVGHQVEITARPIEEPANYEPSRTDGEPKTAPEPGARVEKRAERLTVTAIKQVFTTCR